METVTIHLYYHAALMSVIGVFILARLLSVMLNLIRG